MIVSIIVTADQQSVIGRDDTLPWRSQSSYQRLNSLTRRGIVIVGRKHHESILKRRKGEPLKRPTIVLSRNPAYSAPEPCLTAQSVEEAIKAALTRNTEEVFVIGGAETYRETLPVAGRIYLTLVHAFSGGNVHFPFFQGYGWELRGREPEFQKKRDECSLSFLTFERRAPVPQPA